MKYIKFRHFLAFSALAVATFSSCALKLNALVNLTQQSATSESIPAEDCQLELDAFLGRGTFDTVTSKNKTTVNSLGYLPLSSPYAGAPYFQVGSETVPAGFFTTYPEISDWVLVELRSTTAASSVVARKSAFLDENGRLRDLSGNFTVTFNVVPGDYHVVLYHRSHLAVISSTKVTMSSAALASYDFTDASTKSLQGATGGDLLVELVAGKWSMLVGDLNYDNVVNSGTDGAAIYAIQQAGTGFAGVPTAQFSGYSIGDLTANGQVRYVGASNDRDIISVSAGGGSATLTGSSYISYPLVPVAGGSLFSAFAGSSFLKLKVFLSAPYNSGTGKMSTLYSSSALIPTTSPYGADWNTSGATSTPVVTGAFLTAHPELVDWVQIELRLVRSGSPLARVSGFLDEDGNVLSTAGSTDLPLPVSNGSYYVVVRHRSHLSVLTAEELTTSSSPSLYDLTSEPSRTYLNYSNVTTQYGGTSDINGGSVFGMVSGDFNQDGYVNCGAAGRDDDYLLNTILGGDSNAVVSTYQTGDMNWDGSIAYSIGSNDYGALFTSLTSNCTRNFRKYF